MCADGGPPRAVVEDGTRTCGNGATGRWSEGRGEGCDESDSIAWGMHEETVRHNLGKMKRTIGVGGSVCVHCWSCAVGGCLGLTHGAYLTSSHSGGS